MTEHSTGTRVVVVGGGYAGATAANHLRKNPDVGVTLVNARPQFVERIRLHQLVADTHGATVDYAGLLAEGVRLVVGDVTRIDTARREVVVAGGERLPYDYVIYAAGSTATVPASVPGAVEHAWPLGELEAAQRLHEIMGRRGAVGSVGAGTVTVVGGGLTGIEAASELAERGSTVRLVAGGTLGPSLSRRGRRSVARWFARHGVEVREAAAVAEVRADAVVLDDGSVLPSTVTIWTAGFGVPALARDSGLATDEQGRLLTDETLTSVDDDRVLAAGDAAAPSGHPLRMSCQAARPMGAQAASTVLSRIAGSPPAALDQAFFSQCVSLGRRAATVQMTRFDDTPVNVSLGGRPGAAIKEVICWMTVSMLRREARRPGSALWLRGGRRGRRAVTGA